MNFLDVCEESGFLSLILLAKEILEIIAIIVPIILIIMVAVQLGKIVLGDVKLVPKVTKSIVFKMIAAVAVFFMPTLVNLLLTTLGRTSYDTGTCWNNANTATIAYFRAIEEAEKIKLQNDKQKENEAARKAREENERLREEQRKENAELSNKYKLISGVFETDVVYYNQCDFREYPYGTYGTICSHGCGPTSSAVIASTFLGVSGHTPIDTTAAICGKFKGCTSSGTNWGANASYLKSLGLNVEGPYWGMSEKNADILIKKLSTGKYLGLILSSNKSGNNPFTSGGHYFVLTGVKNGELTIAQVSKPKQNDVTWPLSVFRQSGPDGQDTVYFYLVSKEAV